MLKIKPLFRFLLLFFALSTTALAQPMQLLPSVGEQYRKALELYDEKQYGNAQHLFDEVVRRGLEERESEALALYYAALCAVHLYQGDAKRRIEAFADKHPAHPLRYQLFYEYANGQFSVKRYRYAAEYYERVEENSLDSENRPEFLFKKAYSLLMEERSNEALPLFFKLKNGSSAYASSSRYYYAHLLYLDSNYAAALTNFLPLQEDPVFGPLVPYYLAHIYHSLEDYDQLVEVGEDLVANATESRAPEIAKLLADAFYNKRDFANSKKYLELYRAKGGRMRLQDHYQAGYVAYRLNDYQEAIASFNKITRGPAQLLQNTYYHLADSYLKRGEKNRAMTAFMAAGEIEEDPAITEDALYNHAKLSYELASPFKDALSSLLDYRSRYPQSEHLQEIDEYIANVYITTKDYPRALEAIQRTGMKSPKMREAYQRLSFLQATDQYRSGQYQAALDRFETVAALPASQAISALALYWSGECYYRLLEYQNALDAYRQYRESSRASGQNEFVTSFYNSGYAAYKLFDFKLAAQHFRSFVRQASAQNSRRADAYLRLGDSYLLTGGYLLAADFYQKAIDVKSPESDYAYFQRAECMGLAGKNQEKIEQLNLLTRRYPGSSFAEDAAFEKGITYLQMDNYPSALQAFDTYQKKHPKSSRWVEAELKKGLIYSNADQNAQAIRTFQSITKKYPQSNEALEAVRLAEIVYKRENRIEDYLDWVATLDFVDFEKSTLDSTTYQAAFDAYAQAQYSQALKAFSAYLKRFSPAVFDQKANYYAAQSALRIKDSSAAEKHYKALVGQAPHSHTSEALHFLADLEMNRKQYAQARDYYFQLQMAARRSQERHEAEVGLLRCAYALGDYDGVVKQARNVLSDTSFSHSQRREARYKRAKAYYQQEKWSFALVDFKQLQKSSKDEILAEAYLREAEILHRTEAYDSSNAVINRMVEALPSYKEWKMKGLLVMARNFWKLDDIFQANYILDFLEESESSPEMLSEVKDLREEIRLSEQRAIEAKSRLMREQNSPIKLNTEKGLQIIDAAPDQDPESEKIDKPQAEDL